MKRADVQVNVGIPSGFSTRMIQDADDYKNTLATYGISKVFGMWVNGGYGDQWQLTASVYGGQLYIQSYSQYASTLKRDITIHIFGI